MLLVANGKHERGGHTMGGMAGGTAGGESGETMAARIERKLSAAFAPVRLQVVDESHKHAGHSGWRPGGETHFRVEIVSEAFSGQSRVARQRSVYQALSEELAERVHALTLRTLTPEADSGGADSGGKDSDA